MGSCVPWIMKHLMILLEALSYLMTDVLANFIVLKSTLDGHAPEKTRVAVLVPCVPWYSNDFGIQKNIGRKLEPKWRSTRLPAVRECYVIQNSVVNKMITSAKQDYYSSKIQENSRNARILFKTVEQY